MCGSLLLLLLFVIVVFDNLIQFFSFFNLHNFFNFQIVACCIHYMMWACLVGMVICGCVYAGALWGVVDGYFLKPVPGSKTPLVFKSFRLCGRYAALYGKDCNNGSRITNC